MVDKLICYERKRGDFLFVAKKDMGKEEMDRLVHIYTSSFGVINSLSPCVQSYSRDEIEEVVLDSEMTKYVVYLKDLVIGFGLATTNLAKVPWASLDFYMEKFSFYIENNKLFYFKGIVIAPEYQDITINIDGGKEVKVVAELFNFIACSFPDDAILAFDCSEKINFWLCDAIMSSTGCFSTPQVSDGKTFLDKQIYHVLHKKGKVKNLFKRG